MPHKDLKIAYMKEEKNLTIYATINKNIFFVISSLYQNFQFI